MIFYCLNDFYNVRSYFKTVDVESTSKYFNASKMLVKPKKRF